ncbi:hypothetical protein XELAEV_18017854mg [Xenopus laevis]|uniref:Uncharacterized protein n=1 Tax=Xenopus laevis TaxID=8355 RepID=A0A974HTD4_XENLA|nr:hypothetical protein XELAEV_18017854mg [Xenopus laevis]
MEMSIPTYHWLDLILRYKTGTRKVEMFKMGDNVNLYQYEKCTKTRRNMKVGWPSWQRKLFIPIRQPRF